MPVEKRVNICERNEHKMCVTELFLNPSARNFAPPPPIPFCSRLSIFNVYWKSNEYKCERNGDKITFTVFFFNAFEIDCAPSSLIGLF